MSQKINLIVSIALILWLAAGTILTILALPVAEVIVLPAVAISLAWIFIIRPKLLK